MVSLNIKFSNKTFYSILIFSVLFTVIGIGIALDSGNPIIHGHTSDEIQGTGKVCLQNASDDEVCVDSWAELTAIAQGQEIFVYNNPGFKSDRDSPHELCNNECDPTTLQSGDNYCVCLLKGDTKIAQIAISKEFCAARGQTYLSHSYANSGVSLKRYKCKTNEANGCKDNLLTDATSKQYISKIVCVIEQ